MKYLLDTNAWVEYLRAKNTRMLKRIQAQQAHDLLLSSIVLGELYYGAFHSGPNNVTANIKLIEQLKSAFPVISFDTLCAEHYGKLREHLTSIGLKIGPNDTMIAATSLAYQFVLVTHNTTEFSRVPGLLIEDWQLP